MILHSIYRLLQYFIQAFYNKSLEADSLEESERPLETRKEQLECKGKSLLEERKLVGLGILVQKNST